MKEAYLYFSIIIFILACMDGFNFHFPHNKGWFSLTYGKNRISWDAWHTLKRLLLLVIFFYMAGIRPDSFMWWVHGGLFALLAYLGQRLIYNTLIKL